MSSTWLCMLACVSFVFVVNILSVNAKGHKVSYLSVVLEAFQKGISKKDVGDSKIVGGYWANHRDFPFVVSIQVYYSAWSHHCGGSIITPYLVVTACHCIVITPIPRRYRHPSTLRVVAGTGTLYTSSPNQQVSRVARLEVNPGCNNMLWISDGGVIVLQDGFRFNSYVRPIALYSKNLKQASNRLWQMQRENKQCFTPGWGSYDGRNYGSYLKYTEVTLLTSNQCSNLNCRYSAVCNVNYWQYRQVCAINRRAIFCYGDSGGPLVCDGQLFGVVSYHYGCHVNHPMIYTDIIPVLQVLNRYLTQSWSKERLQRPKSYHKSYNKSRKHLKHHS